MIKIIKILLIPFLVLFVGFQLIDILNLTSKIKFAKKPETTIFVPKDLTLDFNSLIDEIKKENGTYSIYINDLKSQKTYVYNENQQYYAASLFKLPVGVAVLKQIDAKNATFDDKLTYYPRHATFGTGYINQTTYNTEYSLNDLLRALFKNSDNTAQTMLLEKYNINTKTVREVFPKLGTTDYYHLNESSALELGEYLSTIYSGTELSTTSKKYLFDVMHKTDFDKYFATNINGSFSHKIGLWGGLIHDCGIITDKDIVVCVMSTGATESQFMEISKKIAAFLNLL